jgi:hypothetical protein
MRTGSFPDSVIAEEVPPWKDSAPSRQLHRVLSALLRHMRGMRDS